MIVGFDFVFQSLKNSLSALIALGATRLELAATELEEERLRLADLALSACLALFFGGLAVILSLLFIIVLMWDVQRLLTIGLLAMMFMVLGGWCAWRWRDKARRKPRFMAATLAEFNLDVQALRRPAGVAHE